MTRDDITAGADALRRAARERAAAVDISAAFDTLTRIYGLGRGDASRHPAALLTAYGPVRGHIYRGARRAWSVRLAAVEVTR